MPRGLATVTWSAAESVNVNASENENENENVSESANETWSATVRTATVMEAATSWGCEASCQTQRSSRWPLPRLRQVQLCRCCQLHVV